MERDPRSNRTNAPIAQAGPEEATRPLGSPAPAPRPRRRRRGLNPWYFVLITGLPLLILAVMLVPVAGGWPPPGHSTVPTPTPVWRVYEAFFGEEQFRKLELAPSSFVPAPELGPGWYLVKTGITNNTNFDMQDINVRAFFYDEAGEIIGAGLADTGGLKRGEKKDLAIQAQLGNGPAPRPGTPNPAPPEGTAIKRHEVKIVSILPAATPGPASPTNGVPSVIPLGTPGP